MAIFDYLSPSSWFRRSSTPALPGPPPAPPPRAQHQPKRPGGGNLFTRLLSRYDSLVNSLSGLGGSYDKGTTARPDTTRQPLAFHELTALYRWNGYAQRYVDILAQDATRKGWKVKDSTPNVDPMKGESKRLSIPAHFREGLQWARLYGGAVIFIVVDEELPADYATNPRRLLEKPLDPARLLRVRNLIVMDPSEAQPIEFEGNPRSPRFRSPSKWMLSPNANAAMQELTGGQVVHHSRVIYLPGRQLPSSVRMANNGFDDSILEGAWDAVRNKTSIDQAAALLAQEIKISVMKIEGLAGLNTSDQADLFEMRMRVLARSKSLANVALVGAGEEFTTTATPFTGFEHLDGNARQALQAVTGMPAQLLFGDAPGGLNTDGESHRSLWGNIVAAYQEDRLLEPLTYVYSLIFAAKEGAFRGVTPETWEVEFNPLDQLTETQAAALEKTHAETDAIRVNAGILPAEHVARSRFSAKGYQNDMLPYDPEADAAAQLAEADRLLATPGGVSGGAGPSPAAPANRAAGAAPTANNDESANLLPDATIDAFAEKLTAAGVARCEHGSSNRCRICGIERVRDFEVNPDGTPKLGADGSPVWSVKWRPIYSPIAADPAGAQDAAAK